MLKNSLKFSSRGFNYVLLILIIFFTAGVFFNLPAAYYNKILLINACLITAGIVLLTVRRIIELLNIKKEQRLRYFAVKTAGSIMIHVSVVLILAAWFQSSFYSVSTYQEAGAGAAIHITQFGTPFDISVKDVRADYYDDGSPQQYATRIEIAGVGIPAADGVVTVNHPLKYRGVKIYQYGYARTDSGSILSGLLMKTDPGLPLLYAGSIGVLASAAVKVLALTARGKKADI